MSSEIGRKMRCDRCGSECFLKLVGTDVLDGGYTRSNKFEEKPAGWGFVRNWEDTGYIDLCPSCNKEYRETARQFMEGKR